MIKVFHALAYNEGLSIHIYESIDHAPPYVKDYVTMTRDGIMCYHSPSAEAFWDTLNHERHKIGNWKTIVTDKRK